MFKKKLVDNTDVFAYISGEPLSINLVLCSVAW